MTCFVHTLEKAIQDKKMTWKRILKFLALVIIPQVCIALLYFKFLNWLTWKIEAELVYIDVLKFLSIGFLAYHTKASVSELTQLSGLQQRSGPPPAETYKVVSFYMFFMAAVLVGHTIIMIFFPAFPPSPDHIVTKIYRLAKCEQCVVIIDILAFLYMPWFIYENIRFIKESGNNMGANLFARAFIYGVNLPSIVAFFLIFVTYYFAGDHFKNPEIFLAGSIAFLIYSSTAASYLVDHYSRPFLVACRSESTCLFNRE